MDVQTLSCFKALDTHFSTANPRFKRQGELLKLKPNRNESFSAYMARLKEHSEESNLHNITHEDVILLIATMHYIEEELGKDIKHFVNPSWLVVERLAEKYERSMIDEEPHKAGQAKKNAGKIFNQGRMPKHPHMKGKCYRYCSTSHRPSKCKIDKNRNAQNSAS